MWSQIPRKKIKISIILIVTGILLSVIYIKVNNGNHKNSLLINEVCSHNDAIIYNDIGEYTDYVELYNNSDKVVFIDKAVAGFAIGDDESIYLSDTEGNIVDIATLPHMEASVISHIRFGREESEEKYKENVEIIRDFFAKRRPYIMEHLE